MDDTTTIAENTAIQELIEAVTWDAEAFQDFSAAAYSRHITAVMNRHGLPRNQRAWLRADLMERHRDRHLYG